MTLVPRLTKLADQDVKIILSETNRMFGPKQVWIYTTIIEKGIDLICEDPWRQTSKSHDDMAPGIRSFHLRLVSGKARGASHILYYLPEQGELLILRILADSMLAKRRVTAAVAETK